MKNEEKSSSRRNFIKTTGALTAGLVASGVLGNAASAAPQPFNPATPDAMPTRNLGRTGYRVGIFSLGGQATLEQPDKEAESVAIIERAIDLGVNYLDTAAMYGGTGRWSQRYIGQVMKRRRKEVYLASKTHDRTRDGSSGLSGQKKARTPSTAEAMNECPRGLARPASLATR